MITTVASGIAGVSGICAGGGATYLTDFTGMTVLRLDAAGPVIIARNLDTPLSCAVSGGAVYVVEAGGSGTIRIVHGDGMISTLSR